MRALLWLGLILLFAGCTTLPEVFPDATPERQVAVVLDIDGTLTPSPWRFWQARDNAAEAVQHYADQGYEIVYITARIRLLQCQIPGWLEDEGFPAGNLYVTQSAEDRDDAEAFKRRILSTLLARGWSLQAAFGDSSSDFAAYEAVGIPREGVYGLTRSGEDDCKSGPWNECLRGWGLPPPALPSP